MVRQMGLEVCPVVAVGGQEIFELYYPGDDLGAVYSPDSTAFRVFAPTALGVSVMLYSSRQSAAGWEVPMSPDCDGTWLAVVFGDLAGICYTYRVFHGGKQGVITRLPFHTCGDNADSNENERLEQ